MNVLVTGVAGQLGFDVINELIKRGHNAVGSDIISKEKMSLTCEYIELDITDSKTVESCITLLKPDAVVHCAAWTAVDAAEEEENKSKVLSINVIGTENIAKAALKVNAKLLYVSTDYVFDGSGEKPWEVNDKPSPINFYGNSKLLGEKVVSQLMSRFFIVRTSWAFGMNGNNFVKTILGLGKKYETLRVVNDQIGTPTYTFDLARLLVDMIETDKYGIYHATNEGGYISWCDFAKEILKIVDSKTIIIPITSREYSLSKATRPLNSRLGKSCINSNGFKLLPSWQDAIQRYIKILELK